ncbi:hypothetical protein BB560_005127, partial [Smittium megazygosporum]
VEEKQNEIEALKSIYGDDFLEDEKENAFKIKIGTDTGLDSEETVYLCIVHTELYPDEPPEFDIETQDNSKLNSKDLEELRSKLDEMISDHLGMAMVYSMVMTLKDQLEELLAHKEEQAVRIENERIEQEIALEQKKFIGTPVTKETFLFWKKNFTEEQNALKKISEIEIKKIENKKARLTGRELFEQDKSMIDSDNTFIQEGETSVEART